MKIMVDPNSPVTSRVRAADRILNGARQAMELEETQIRLAALERAESVRRTEQVIPPLIICTYPEDPPAR